MSKEEKIAEEALIKVKKVIELKDDSVLVLTKTERKIEGIVNRALEKLEESRWS